MFVALVRSYSTVKHGVGGFRDDADNGNDDNRYDKDDNDNNDGNDINDDNAMNDDINDNEILLSMMIIKD